MYGRDREARELTDLVIAERTVLFLAPSGAGKTSLLQAAVIPRLMAEGFDVLGPLRVSDPPPRDCANRYVWSTNAGLLDADADEQADIPERSLADALVRTSDGDGPLEQARVLVFDQFEEILSIDPTDWEAKNEFFRQLRELLDDRDLCALFAIREDYVGGLDRFAQYLAFYPRNRYRLGLLRPAAAVRAIQEPAVSRGIEFTASAADELVSELSTTRAQTPDGVLTVRGGDIEPVVLQVVCHQLWHRMKSTRGDSFTCVDAEDIGRFVDIDNALGQFYAGAVATAAERADVSQWRIRRWFERALITEQGLRSSTTMGPEGSDRDTYLLAELEDRFLIRGDVRGGILWYELAHDRLISAIQHDNQVWSERNLEVVQIRAEAWDRAGRRKESLMARSDYRRAARWLAEHGDEATDVERDFLEESQRHGTGSWSIPRSRLVLTVVSCLALGELIVILVLF